MEPTHTTSSSTSTQRSLRRNWVEKPLQFIRNRPLVAALICWELTLGLAFAIWFAACLPKPLFNDPCSTVVEDRNGALLGARIAADGQWRFPENQVVPEKFEKAILCFEDKHFYQHPGVDPHAIARAMKQNFLNGEVVSGGSTLSMQVIRLSRKGQSRSYSEKVLEMLLALRMELSYSKAEILGMYASHAPFGGNVVGLDAAAWRYYGRGSDRLSWSEMATLAVLPNSPSLIHPGKNRDLLEAKRNRLLDRMEAADVLDSTQTALAKIEPLPGSPHPLPNYTPHLTSKIQTGFLRGKARSQTRTRTTVDVHLQSQANQIVQHHSERLRDNGIKNAAALIVEVETGDVLAYVGNSQSDRKEYHCQVDCIPAPRSTGSIMKPFLYAWMLNDGDILPATLVPDVPTFMGGYAPKNYNRTYDGAVPAKKALARSLNIPAVRMLHQYGHIKFHENLQNMGMTTLSHGADHYGLSLILGGAEGSLWDFAAMYASMARTLDNHYPNAGKYNPDDFRALNFEMENSIRLREIAPETQDQEPVLSAGAIYQTFEAMVEVARPEGQQDWRQYSGSRKIAWKTGTSYGFRDGWAIGCTPTHVVAVWVGNADGEGRPGLTGVTAAAPILFDLFDAVGGPNEWFEEPIMEMAPIATCRKSGHRATDLCTETDTLFVLKTGLRTTPCPYHKLVHLTATGQHRVHSDCESPMAMLHESWFVLPPAQEGHYRVKHPEYQALPPYRDDCRGNAFVNGNNMELIYPKSATRIFVPINLDGSSSSTVFEVSHRHDETRVFWHLDNKYIGSTEHIHQMSLNPPPGKHVLTIVDESGEEIRRRFEIVGRKS